MPRLSGTPTARFGATQPSASCTAFRTLLLRYKTPDNRAVAAATSKTLYVGNLAFVTTEQQIIEVFRRCGPVKQVIMGLNRESRKPCGFAFVIYHRRDSVVAAMNYLNGSKLDNRYIRLQIDKGFREGRQFGRGVTGGQVRDELRVDFDGGRGGLGVLAAQRTALSRRSAGHRASMAEFTAQYTEGSGGGGHVRRRGGSGGAAWDGQKRRRGRGGHDRRRREPVAQRYSAPGAAAQRPLEERLHSSLGAAPAGGGGRRQRSPPPHRVQGE
ncbi:Cbp20 [Symbiodinium sp. KB8]|nr:Cbp20 [Symbiodinium sp. KB8]